MSEQNKKKKAKHQLEDLDVIEVSLVSRPAIGRTYLLMKEADGTLPEEEAVIQTGLPTEVGKATDAGNSPADTQHGVNTMNEKIVELLKSVELSDEARETLTGALDSIIKAEVPEEIMVKFYELAGYKIPEREVEVKVEVPVEKADTENKEEILKGLDDKVLALIKEQDAKIEDAQKEAAEAKETAKTEKEARVLQTFVQKAATEYSEFGIEAVNLGAILKAIDEKLEKEEASVVLKIFTVAKEQIIASKQDEEFGSPGVGAEDSSEPKYVGAAKVMVEKGEATSEAEAVAKLIKSNPELF